MAFSTGKMLSNCVDANNRSSSAMNPAHHPADDKMGMETDGARRLGRVGGCSSKRKLKRRLSADIALFSPHLQRLAAEFNGAVACVRQAFVARTQQFFQWPEVFDSPGIRGAPFTDCSRGAPSFGSVSKINMGSVMTFSRFWGQRRGPAERTGPRVGRFIVRSLRTESNQAR